MTEPTKAEKLGFDLQIYFVHPTVLMTAVDTEARVRLQQALAKAKLLPKVYENALLQSTFSDETKRFIVKSEIPPLEELLVTGQSLQGKYVMIDRSFYFKGASKAAKYKYAGRPQPYVGFRVRLPEYPQLRITGNLDPLNLTTDTAYTKLERQSRVLMLAYVTDENGGEVKLRPIVIADKVHSNNQENQRLVEYTSMQRLPEDIDEFSKMKDIDPRDVDINELKKYRETQVKAWLAEIIGEQFVPKDWAGEYSDLCTSHLQLNGQRLDAAFLLKGPAAFHPMEMTDLGKKGDQIVRLFQEPAGIYILQHCHSVSSAVRHTMEAFASRWYKQSPYCIIDGNCTMRILKAYGKI
jgi:hypothetical protein